MAEAKTADGLLTAARAAFAKGRPRDALQLCDRAALLSEEGRYGAARLRADILLSLDDPRGALSCLDSVAEPMQADPGLDCARGLALFALARLAEADNALRSALRGAPELADAHYTLGLIAELSKTGEENAYFRRASQLAPGRFPRAPKLAMAAFEAAVAAAANELPGELVEQMHSLPILIAELPNPADLVRQASPVSPLTFAMRVGVRSLGVSPELAGSMRPALLLFKRNLERAHREPMALIAAIAETLRRSLLAVAEASS